MQRIARAILIVLATTAACLPAHAQRPDLNALLTKWDSDPHPDLCSVLVLQDGQIVAERYYNGETADTLRDVRSAGKSITALLVGAALDRGKIGKVTDQVQQYWPAAKGSAIGAVSLDAMLTMRSGLAAVDTDAASPGNEDKLDEAPDPVAFALAVPRLQSPGQKYIYNSLTAYMAGLLVEQATGADLDNFARAALFDPLGITRWQWGRDAGGHPKGQGNLSLRTRDLAKIGQMVLGKGVYDGKRVISAAWIEASLAPRVPIAADDPYADHYGYFWYSKTVDLAGARIPVHFASGNGGNKIYVIPSRQAVVVVTSRAYGRGYGQARSEAILKAMLTAQ